MKSLSYGIISFLIRAVSTKFDECSDNPVQQPYRWLTDEERTSLAGGIIDGMFKPSSQKQSESLILRSHSAKFGRQTNGGGNGGGDIEMGPQDPARIGANSQTWSSLQPAQWESLQRGLQQAQTEAMNKVLDAVAQQNQESNQRALNAIETIGTAAADSVRQTVESVTGSLSNNVNSVTQALLDNVGNQLRQGGFEWQTQIVQAASDRLPNIVNTVNERLAGLIDGVADQVTQGNTAMDARQPPELFRGRYEIINRSCAFVYKCGAKVAKAFRCIFLCNMNAGDRATRTRTACQNFFAFITLGAIATGGIILLFNRLQLPIRGAATPPGVPPAPPPDTTDVTRPPAPADPNNTTSSVTSDAHKHIEEVPVAVNIRVESSRGPLPQGLPVVEEPMVTQLGNETLPEYAREWITHPRRKLGCTDPPADQESKSKSRRKKRDDPNDDRCLPNDADDLQSIVWNLMWTQFFPKMNQGIMSASYSLYDEALSGIEDLYKAGALKVDFWVTDKPDIDGMKHGPGVNDTIIAAGNDINSTPSWTYRDHSTVYGQECFDNSFPANSTAMYSRSKGVPTKNWLFAFNDACKNAFGNTGTKATTPKDFIYAGPGYNSDPENGVGFNGTYHAEGCQDQIKCTDLLGMNGITSGDLGNHFDYCMSVSHDRRYHGGMIYHSTHKKKKKRDDPWVPNRCGYLQIEPLGDGGIEIQTGGAQKLPPNLSSDELK